MLIADNVHKSASESVFIVFNEIEHGKIKFLFAAREKQLNKNKPEIELALSNLSLESQYRIEFTKDNAALLVSKAVEVTFGVNLPGIYIEYSNMLYDYSPKNPLLFNLGLRYVIKGGSKKFEDFIQIEIDNWIEKIDAFKDDNIWNAAIFASLIGIPDISINISQPVNMLDCSDFTLDELRSLANENILLKEDLSDVFRISHEIFAYEFLSRIYKQKFNNSQKKFDQEHNITNVIRCIWEHADADTTIDIFNTCSYLYEINRYNPISRLIASTYVVPASIYIAPSHFTEKDKITVFCYGLSTYYRSLKDYKNAIAYCNKALEIDENNVDALGNKGLALIDMGSYEEAITCYNKILAIDGKNVDALAKKVYLYLGWVRMRKL